MLAPFCMETQGRGRTTGHCGPSRSARTRQPRQPLQVSMALGRHVPVGAQPGPPAVAGEVHTWEDEAP